MQEPPKQQEVKFDYTFKVGSITTNEEYSKGRVEKYDVPTIKINIPGLNLAENEPYTISIYPNSVIKSSSFSTPDHRENYDQFSDFNLQPYYKVGLFSKYVSNLFNTGDNFYEQNNYQSRLLESGGVTETRYDGVCVNGKPALKMYTEFEGVGQGGDIDSYKTQNIGHGKFRLYDMMNNKVLEVSVTNDGNITQSVRVMTEQEIIDIPKKAEAVKNLTEERYKNLLNDNTKEPVFDDKTKNCLAVEFGNQKFIDPRKFQNFVRELTGDNSEMALLNISNKERGKSAGLPDFG